jgi:2-polyprenyl-6-hydroxyphenyl methylase/3-demethylubiquinone-9 3-methyltransferase
MQLTADEHVRCAIAFHSQLAGTWENRYRRPGFQSRLRVLGECLQDADIQDQQWLDAGCGSGTLSRYLADRGGQILGVDASAEMLRNATLSSLEPRHRCLEFRHVDSIAALPVADCSLDGILCSSVLEYVPDVFACLAEFARVLRPGGRLLVSVPNRRSIVRRLQVSTHRFAQAMGRNWFPFIEHSHHEFTPFAFRNLMEQVGFTTDKIIPFGSPIPQWLQRREFAGSLLMFSAVRRRPGL